MSLFNILGFFTSKDGSVSIQFGNFLYMITIIVLILIIYFSIKLCHKRGKHFANKYILAILIFNFCLHFVKQLLPTYSKEWPNSLWKSTFENLCAALIILAPFIYISKNKYLKDYMFYIGVISGVGVYLFPAGVFGIDLRNIDAIVDVTRFYICHIPLALCGILMVEEGFHKLDYKRLWVLPFSYIGFQTIIFLNDLILFVCQAGAFYDYYGPISDRQSWLDFFYREGIANESANFGFRESFDSMLSWLYIPYLMTFKLEGRTYFIPVLYQFIPVCILTWPVGLLMSYPWQKEQYKIDYLSHKIKKIKVENKSNYKSKLLNNLD